MKKIIYKMPKMKLPILEHFKFEKIWNKQEFIHAEKKKIENLANKIDQILENMPEKERNQIVSPPDPSWDPSVTISEWNDFLAVAFGVKPACIIGNNFKGKTYNPIAKFAKENELFNSLSFSDYWDFGLDEKFHRTYHKVEDGFIYNSHNLEETINKYPEVFKDLVLKNITAYLRELITNSDKNRDNFNLKLGLLLGYSTKEIQKFIENEKKYYK